MTVTSIAAAVVELRRIAERSVGEGSRLGYFAALYGRVTAAVKARIDEGGFFEDGARMERFDVAFANRYFDALDRHRAGQPVPACWALAFEAAARSDLIVLQHLYVGLNAHLLFDLGIAAAQTCPGGELPSLRGDFDRINDVVGSLMRTVDGDVGRVSPWLHVVDELAGGIYAGANDAAIHLARHLAWNVAEKLAPLDEGDRRRAVERLDGTVTLAGEQILHPSFPARPVVNAILGRETMPVTTVIRVLLGDLAPTAGGEA